MGGIVAAWMVGEGIIVYRAVKANHAPPMPGALMISSGLFLALGFLATSAQARPLATTLAWGFDIAAFLNLWPTATGTPVPKTAGAGPSPPLTNP